MARTPRLRTAVPASRACRRGSELPAASRRRDRRLPSSAERSRHRLGVAGPPAPSKPNSLAARPRRLALGLGHRCRRRRRMRAGSAATRRAARRGGRAPAVARLARLLGASRAVTIGPVGLLHGRPAARDRGRRGHHRGGLLRAHDLGALVELHTDRSRPLAGGDGEPVVDPGPQARTVEQRQNDRRRQQLGQPDGSGPVLAQRRPAPRARRQVCLQQPLVVRAGVPVTGDGQKRLVAPACGTGSDLAEALEEAAPPLGERAVHLGPAEAGARRDLVVGVTERLQDHALHLARLQRPERLGGPVHALPAGRRLVRFAIRGGHGIRTCGLVVHGHGPLALPAQRERLVLDDRVQPGPELVATSGGRLREEDLEAALVGVLGVVPAQGEATRGALERHGAVRDELDRRREQLVALWTSPPCGPTLVDGGGCVDWPPRQVAAARMSRTTAADRACFPNQGRRRMSRCPGRNARFAGKPRKIRKLRESR